ncbi:hypothetical protein RHOER0001_3162 [Rhodococcus erythropolis SK121]|nr:hypothetical protein RHOER0001_3162 [Rhodococcus erythropolis SK121]
MIAEVVALTKSMLPPFLSGSAGGVWDTSCTGDAANPRRPRYAWTRCN